MKPETSCPVPLSDMLARFGVELDDCRQALLRIEDAMQPMTAKSETQTPLTARLQDIDLLAQILRELASCMASVSSEVAKTSVSQMDVRLVISPLRLEGLRFRLSGAAHDQPKLQPVELF